VAQAAAAVYEQVCLKALQYPQVGFSKLQRAFSTNVSPFIQGMEETFATGILWG
jgi:hypothetical protein